MAQKQQPLREVARVIDDIDSYSGDEDNNSSDSDEIKDESEKDLLINDYYEDVAEAEADEVA